MLTGLNIIGGGIYAPPSENLKIWYRMDSIVASGGDAAEFTDKTGNGKDALHTNPARYPQIISGGLNGKTITRWNPAGANSLYCDGSDITSPTIIVLAKPTASGTNKILVARKGTVFPLFSVDGGSGTVSMHGGAASKQGTTNVTDGNWHLIEGFIDNVNRHIYVDGVQESLPSGNIGTGTTLPSLWVGNRNDATANYMNGDLAEILIYEGEITAAQRAQITKYINNYYGLGF